MKKKDMVTITVYGTKKQYERKEAMKFFLECIVMCEGSERDRYADIYVALQQGYTFIDQDNEVYL